MKKKSVKMELNVKGNTESRDCANKPTDPDPVKVSRSERDANYGNYDNFERDTFHDNQGSFSSGGGYSSCPDGF